MPLTELLFVVMPYRPLLVSDVPVTPTPEFDRAKSAGPACDVATKPEPFVPSPCMAGPDPEFFHSTHGLPLEHTEPKDLTKLRTLLAAAGLAATAAPMTAAPATSNETREAKTAKYF